MCCKISKNSIKILNDIQLIFQISFFLLTKSKTIKCISKKHALLNSFEIFNIHQCL